MDGIIWQTQTGFFSTEVMGFVEHPTGFTPLYSDTSDPDNLALADKAFLRETLLFYGFSIPPVLQNSLEKREAIQAAYTTRLIELQEAKSGAEMRDDAESVTEIKAEYMALLQKMNQKIQEVPGD